MPSESGPYCLESQPDCCKTQREQGDLRLPLLPKLPVLLASVVIANVTTLPQTQVLSTTCNLFLGHPAPWFYQSTTLSRTSESSLFTNAMQRNESSRLGCSRYPLVHFPCLFQGEETVQLACPSIVLWAQHSQIIALVKTLNSARISKYCNSPHSYGVKKHRPCSWNARDSETTARLTIYKNIHCWNRTLIIQT